MKHGESMSYAALWNAEHGHRLMIGAPLHSICTFFVEQLSYRVLSDVRVLDVGCGTGTHSRWLAAIGVDVEAFDSSEEAIARARALATPANLKYRVHDATDIFPYPDSSFDYVLDVRALENLSRDEALFALRQTVRVLKPRGRFVSLTASELRSPAATTVGVVRKVAEKEARVLLIDARFQSSVMWRETQGVDDWFMVAYKGGEQ
jgi:SAM-dependent methyltransferase